MVVKVLRMKGTLLSLVRNRILLILSIAFRIGELTISRRKQLDFERDGKRLQRNGHPSQFR